MIMPIMFFRSRRRDDPEDAEQPFSQSGAFRYLKLDDLYTSEKLKVNF